MIWFGLLFLYFFICAALEAWTKSQDQNPNVQTLEVDDNSIPSAAHVALHPPSLPGWDEEPSIFTDIQIKPIKGTQGWSSISVKINDRQYRLDMEDEFAKELGKKLK